MQLSLAQEAVVMQARAWLADPRGEQVKMLHGFAGTGKTTIARLLAQDVRAVFCAPTGKAALVLSRAGCVGAQTIHSLIYVPRDAAPGEPLEFDLRGDDPLEHVDLVVADECSMIDARVWADLLAFGKRVLVLGDPFQLPPVRGTSPLSDRAPDWLLTEVHRQARDSGVLRLATDVREGRGASRVPGHYGPEVLVSSTRVEMERVVAAIDQIIVGTNATRRSMNAWARAFGAGGRAVPAMPRRDERLVCLKNDRRRGLANGSTWIAASDARPQGDGYVVDVREDVKPGVEISALPIHAHHFVGRERDLAGMPQHIRKRRAEFDYGYAITGHKSQGSQWLGVCVVDESRVFGHEAARWLYTCATRAQERLIVIQ